jgi:beta-glucanase (GH16 family)
VLHINDESGPFWPLDPFQQTHADYTLQNGDFCDQFHTFGLIWNSQSIQTYLDDPSHIVLNVSITKSFWERGGWKGIDNPWVGGGHDAPFDQEFYLILNVAVGGTNGYFPDGLNRKLGSDGCDRGGRQALVG